MIRREKNLLKDFMLSTRCTFFIWDISWKCRAMPILKLASEVKIHPRFAEVWWTLATLCLWDHFVAVIFRKTFDEALLLNPSVNFGKYTKTRGLVRKYSVVVISWKDGWFTTFRLTISSLVVEVPNFPSTSKREKKFFRMWYRRLQFKRRTDDDRNQRSLQ